MEKKVFCYFEEIIGCERNCFECKKDRGVELKNLKPRKGWQMKIITTTKEVLEKLKELDIPFKTLESKGDYNEIELTDQNYQNAKKIGAM